MGRHRDLGWCFVQRDAIKLAYYVDGTDEAHIERLVLAHPYLDVYPPMSIREWEHFLATEHRLDA